MHKISIYFGLICYFCYLVAIINGIFVIFVVFLEMSICHKLNNCYKRNYLDTSVPISVNTPTTSLFGITYLCDK